MEISKSVKFGLKKMGETSLWFTALLLYRQIISSLYYFAGFTAARWSGNPDILGKLNYRTFQSALNGRTGIANCIIALLIMFAFFYFAAGYFPAKSAANKNHSSLMLKTMIWFFILSVLLRCASLLILRLSAHQTFRIVMISNAFSDIAESTFGLYGIVIISLVSYIYEKFSEKNVFQIVSILFVMQIISFAITLSLGVNAPHFSKSIPPYLGIIEAIVTASIFILSIFIIPETVLQNNFKDGFTRGMYLMKMRGGIVGIYFIIYGVLFAISLFAEKTGIAMHGNMFVNSIVIIINVLISGFTEAFITLSSFRLAYLFENKDAIFEEEE